MTALFFRPVERNLVAYRRMWVVFLTGFAEPLLYLLSIGVGVGALASDVAVGGKMLPYRAFVAPGMLAVSAMNGAILDTMFNFFFKFKYAKTFDSMLATPLGTTDIAVGELLWAQLRGTIYAAAFLVTMAALGLTRGPWVVLGVPAAMLIGFAFGGLGMAATTWMRSFVHFDYVNLALIPLFVSFRDLLPAFVVSRSPAVDRAGDAAVPGRGPRARTRTR
jgi:lipooligosaccharide transport system permease protein